MLISVSSSRHLDFVFIKKNYIKDKNFNYKHRKYISIKAKRHLH